MDGATFYVLIRISSFRSALAEMRVLILCCLILALIVLVNGGFRGGGFRGGSVRGGSSRFGGSRSSSVRSSSGRSAFYLLTVFYKTDNHCDQRSSWGSRSSSRSSVPVVRGVGGSRSSSRSSARSTICWLSLFYKICRSIKYSLVFKNNKIDMKGRAGDLGAALVVQQAAGAVEHPSPRE